jgi:Meckel syndrome type 1 protein
MSTEPDRDPALAALWREHSTETPSPRVDAAILAAAHSAVANAPHGRERSPGQRAWRWWVPLAAAAVVAVVVIGVKPPSQTIVDDAAQSASDMPAASAERPVGKPAAPAEKPSDMPAAPAAKAIAPPVPEPRSPTAAPAPSIATPLSEEPPRQKMEDRRAQSFVAPPPSAATQESSTAQARRDDAVTALSIELHIVTLRTLLDHGRFDEASRELTRFRAAYPDADARLPDDLRAWAKTVR